MPRKQSFAEGSANGRPTPEASCVRALDAWMSLSRLAQRVSDELDNATMPGFLPVIELKEDDSLVIAIRDFTGSTADDSMPVARK